MTRFAIVYQGHTGRREVHKTVEWANRTPGYVLDWWGRTSEIVERDDRHVTYQVPTGQVAVTIVDSATTRPELDPQEDHH